MKAKFCSHIRCYGINNNKMTRICHVAEIKLLLLLPMLLLSLVLCLKLTLAVCNSCTHTAQNKKFSIKDFFSKCDQIRRKLKEILVQCTSAPPTQQLKITHYNLNETSSWQKNSIKITK